jgi:hypothetical protein
MTWIPVFTIYILPRGNRIGFETERRERSPLGNWRTVTNTRPVVVVRTIEELRALRNRGGPSEFTLVLHLAELIASLGQPVNWPKSIHDDPAARNYGTGTGSAGNGTVGKTETAVTRRTSLAELKDEPSTNHNEDTPSSCTLQPP